MWRAVDHGEAAWRDLAARHTAAGTVVVAVDPRDLTIKAVAAGPGAPEERVDRGLVGEPVVNVVHPDDRARAIDVMMEVLRHPGARPPGVYRVRTAGGSFRAVDVASIHVHCPHSAVLLLVSELAGRRRVEALASEQVEILERFAAGESLTDCLAALARLAERHIGHVAVCITAFVDGARTIVGAGDGVDQD